MKSKFVIIIIGLAAVLALGLYLRSAHHGFLPFAGKEVPRLFPVCSPCSGESVRWGYIDSSGKLAINFQFEEAHDFSEGLASVKTGGKWGYVGEDGKFIVNPQFDGAGFFSEGLTWVRISGKEGYIDKAGTYIVNPQFDVAFPFHEGLAIVSTGNKWGFIDKEGKYAVNPQYDRILWGFAEGLAAVEIGNKWGYVDRDGKYAINPQFDGAEGFSEGLAAIKNGDKWGYVDKDGKFAINPQFEKADDFSEGMAAVKIGNKWGYIDKAGKLVINPQYSADKVGQFQRGIAAIDHNLYVNTRDRWVWPNVEALQSEYEQLAPLLNADRGTNDNYVDGTWNICVNNVAAKPLCFQVSKGDPDLYGQNVFRDRNSAQLALKLQIDQLVFADPDGHTLFAIKPTAEGWIPYPGTTPRPFMVQTVPDLPSLPISANGESGTQ